MFRALGLCGICGILLALIGGAAPALAGEWHVAPGSDPQPACQFTFTGPIRPGDLTAITATPAWAESWRPELCLDSPGGSLKEVYDFVTSFRDEGVSFATRVRSGARCESACAILFMFGQSWGANSPYPDRVLEPGARLGFHSPFLGGGGVAEAQREDVFRVALDVARLLMDTSYKATTTAGAPLSQELVSLVLATPGDEMHYVDTLGEMALLGIERVYDGADQIAVPADRDSFAALAERVCVSSYAMTFPRWLVDDGYDFADLVTWVGETLAAGGGRVEAMVEEPASDHQQARVIAVLSGPYTVPGWYSAGAALYCRVELSVLPGPGTYGVSRDTVLVSYGPLFDLDETAVPEHNTTFPVIAAGVVPIDTRY